MADLISKKIQAGDKTFSIQVLRFSNGCFIAVTEGEEAKLGSLEVSISVMDKVNSSTIIPSRFSSIFSSMLGEMSSNLAKGLSLVSLHLSRDLSSDTAKALLFEVKGILSGGEEKG